MDKQERVNHVCPVSAVRSFDNLLRPLLHNPAKLFAPLVKPGMTVMDVGCGGGWASLALARLVGESGLVISADLQPGMLELVRNRAEKAGLMNRIRLHLCHKDRIGLEAELDLAVGFWMVHEVPDRDAFVAEVHGLLKPGGKLFVAEPWGHVSGKAFRDLRQAMEKQGFLPVMKPRAFISHAMLLEKPARDERRKA